MSTEHSKRATPGPWEMDGPQIVANGYGIGSVSGHNTSEGRANAALICAAPDLLAVLVEYLAAADNSMTAEDDTAAMLRFGDAEKAARAVVARARGEA